MKRYSLLICAVVLALAIGVLLGNARVADAAPSLRWTPDELAYYAAVQPVIVDLLAAIEVDPASSTKPPLEVIESAKAVTDLNAPIRLLAVHSLTRFAVAECTNTLAYFGGLKEDDWNTFSAGVIVQMRDFCLLSLRDARTEMARFASANGGFPLEVGATETLTSTTTVTP